MLVMQNPAARAYIRRFIPTMIVYVLLVAAATALSETALGRGPAIWAIALLPALPLLYVFWLIGRYLADQKDEYLRLLEVRKALVATGLTLAATTVLGFLEIYAQMPHVPLFFVPVIWFGGLFVGQVVNWLAERSGA
jgi:hypothetical protein